MVNNGRQNSYNIVFRHFDSFEGNDPTAFVDNEGRCLVDLHADENGSETPTIEMNDGRCIMRAVVSANGTGLKIDVGAQNNSFWGFHNADLEIDGDQNTLFGTFNGDITINGDDNLIRGVQWTGSVTDNGAGNDVLLN